MNKSARIIIMLVVVGFSLFILSIRDQAGELANYGYPGIFLLLILTNGTVLIPIPGTAVVVAFGGVFNPFWVGVAAGAGAAIGELSGYAAGYSGQAVIEKISIYKRIVKWMSHNPFTTTLILISMAAIPNPLFDLFGMAAGSLRIGLKRFIFATLIGKTIEMMSLAYAGAYSIDWISQYMR